MALAVSARALGCDSRRLISASGAGVPALLSPCTPSSACAVRGMRLLTSQGLLVPARETSAATTLWSWEPTTLRPGVESQGRASHTKLPLSPSRPCSKGCQAQCTAAAAGTQCLGALEN